jgi:hypothetical protein
MDKVLICYRFHPKVEEYTPQTPKPIPLRPFLILPSHLRFGLSMMFEHKILNKIYKTKRDKMREIVEDV